ncbi:hypothetical protein CQA57_03650 [Helicobacter anseris]|uniref:Uncharacterized protein n=1 Tax=Helicobacter anseris TaxID=375926 RepID=A0A3D8JAY0_9HELI|nr:hypothetical protein CQA57_03650 [Helicobacter anseris]
MQLLLSVQLALGSIVLALAIFAVKNKAKELATKGLKNFFELLFEEKEAFKELLYPPPSLHQIFVP